ncbi:MAG: hypothetical protein WC963_05325 [Bacilli bacterium]|jgi:hypothetical protein
MERYLKIETQDGKDIMRFDSDYFESLNIAFDSEDNTKSKIDKIDNMLTIKGTLGEKARSESSKLAEWALMSSTDKAAYRKVYIWIVGDDDKIFRHMVYSYCFIVDYVEKFGSDEDGNEKDATFELKLKQKADKLGEITISSEPLRFDALKNGFGK